jgi:serine/threonine protein kinase
MKGVRLTLGQINTWGYEIASGLLYLKEQGIIHRDLKPENILFCEDRAKIADFGLSDYREDLLTAMDAIAGAFGTPLYMPLEAFSNIFDYYTDVFALGVILYQMYAGRNPYPAKNQPELLTMLKARRPHFETINRNDEDRNVELEKLILRMLDKDSLLRPTIEEVLDHPFFEQEELDTTVTVEDSDDEDDGPMSLEEFRRHKMEFGEGTREQFYLYLANLRPFMTPMSMQVFTLMWNKALGN